MQPDLFGEQSDSRNQIPDWETVDWRSVDDLSDRAMMQLYMELIQRNNCLIQAIRDHAPQAVDEDAFEKFEALDRRLNIAYGEMHSYGIESCDIFGRLIAAMRFDGTLDELRRQMFMELDDALVEKLVDSARRRKAKPVWMRRRALELFAETLDDGDFEDALVIELE